MEKLLEGATGSPKMRFSCGSGRDEVAWTGVKAQVWKKRSWILSMFQTYSRQDLMMCWLQRRRVPDLRSPKKSRFSAPEAGGSK